MSVVGEVVGIVACVAAVVSAYKDGGQIIEKIKVKRAQKRAAPPSRLLEESVDQAPEDIEREKKRGVVRFGKTFEDGDHIAIIALQQITIQLQGSLLEELRNAAFDDAVTDFRHLVDVADTGRDKTIDTLLQFKQRLLTAEPIKEIALPQPQPTNEVPAVKPKGALPSPPLTRAHPQTWQPGYVSSRDVSDVEDATSGAENHPARSRKRSSLIGFFSHKRMNSHEIGSRAGTPSVAEEAPRSTASSHSPAPLRGPPSASTGDIRSSVSGASSRSVSTAAAEPTTLEYNPWQEDPMTNWHEGNKASSSQDQTQQHRESVSTLRQPSPTSHFSDHRPSLPINLRNSSVSISVPRPAPENGYLGFCKNAIRLQNGDRKALEKRKEIHDAYSRTGYSHPSIQYLACTSSKCCFAGYQKLDTIWDKVWTDESKGLKFRWAFLAKSHVMQKKAEDKQYAFQCLFCAYAGEPAQAFQGTDCYLEHVAQHRGRMGEVLLYKAQCVNDRVCEDGEEFDINLFPPAAGADYQDRASHMLSDDLLGLSFEPKEMPMDGSSAGKQDSMFSANEPWNEGLSDFHYGGELDRTELE